MARSFMDDMARSFMDDWSLSAHGLVAAGDPPPNQPRPVTARLTWPAPSWMTFMRRPMQVRVGPCGMTASRRQGMSPAGSLAVMSADQMDEEGDTRECLCK